MSRILNGIRPKLMIEKYGDKEITEKELYDWLGDQRFPHCDARILHLPEECDYCKDATLLQEEREQLDVSNSGHQNRGWPCPVEKVRSLKTAHQWHGNAPRHEGDPDPYVDAIIEAVNEFNSRE